VRAIRLLREHWPTAILALAGKFYPPQLHADIEAIPGWECVEYHGWLDRKAVGDLLSRIWGGVRILAPMPIYKETSSNTLFEYMAAGLPVIASDFPEWRDMIDRHGCGLLVDPTKPAEVADAMNWLLSHPEEAEEMGRAGLAAVMSEFNWPSQERRLLDFYDLILGSSRRTESIPQDQ
jgi:glycosyltransferase involved in cell wall biosynthesis